MHNRTRVIVFDVAIKPYFSDSLDKPAHFFSIMNEFPELVETPKAKDEESKGIAIFNEDADNFIVSHICTQVRSLTTTLSVTRIYSEVSSYNNSQHDWFIAFLKDLSGFKQSEEELNDCDIITEINEQLAEEEKQDGRIMEDLCQQTNQ